MTPGLSNSMKKYVTQSIGKEVKTLLYSSDRFIVPCMQVAQLQFVDGQLQIIFAFQQIGTNSNSKKALLLLDPSDRIISYE